MFAQLAASPTPQSPPVKGGELNYWLQQNHAE